MRQATGLGLWHELDRWANQMTEAFDRTWSRASQAMGHRLPIRWEEQEEAIVLHVALPGVNAEELDMAVTRDSLTLKGKYGEFDFGDEATYRRRERPHGEFEHVFRLQTPVDPQTASAEYNNGVLSVTLKKPAELKPHKISVKAG